MLFNSPEFVVFLLIVYAAYRVLPFQFQNYMLLAASYFFYGWWDWRFVFLMALSTAVDFWVGLTMDRGQLSLRERLVSAGFLMLSAILFLGMNPKGLVSSIQGSGGPSIIEPQSLSWAISGSLLFCAVAYGIYRILIGFDEEKRRRTCLIISISTQITILAVFKYFNFFIESLTTVIQDMGVATTTLHLDIILPVGLSFYTFQSMSYAIDIYRRELKPTRKFFDFALFVAFFPQLVAGPINRARHLLPQLSMPRTLSLEDSTRGLYLIVLGLFKKIAIADGVAPVVDLIFGSTGTISWADVIVGTLLFAVQIYADFSGYSDVARGVAKLFGVDLMVNFNQPYFSKSPREFWQRWHISLSTWLGDYLYKPLGGSRGTLAFTCRNLMITMLLGGLWHGAAWNYVLWGFYQGSLLCVHRTWTFVRGDREGSPSNPLKEFLLIAVFFALTCYGWLLFRAHSFDQVASFTTILFTDFGNLDYGGSMPRPSAIIGIVLLGAMEIAQYRRKDAHYYQRLPLPLLGGLIATMIYITSMGISNEPAQFIYFQF